MFLIRASFPSCKSFFSSRNFSSPLFPYAVPPPRGNAAALRAASAPLRFRVCAVRPLRRRNSLRSFFPSDFFPPSPLFPTARFPRTSHAPPPGPAFGGIAMRPPFPPAESALGTSETSKVPPLPLTAAATSLKNTGTLRAGCKSPPAVTPDRGSPRASFQGKGRRPGAIPGPTVTVRKKENGFFAVF